MLKTILTKLSLYKQKKIDKNSINNKKLNNTFNPFVNHDSSGIVVNLISMMNRTPEEDAAIMQRVINLAKYMANCYTEEKINDNVSKFTHISKHEDYYYEVKKIRMNEEQYNQYLDKKALNEKLHKKLPLREKQKRVKL